MIDRVEPVSTLVVAVDGPSGTGKSSVSKGVAIRHGMGYLDTGAMYRAITLGIMRQGVDVTDVDAIAAALGALELRSGTDPHAPTIHLGVNGAWSDVTLAIRDSEVTDAVSHVSAVPSVRELLVELQRAAVLALTDGGRGVIVEGRDIGTVVLPQADVKIYLTASADARASRRNTEDQSRGHVVDVDATRESLERRDRIDTGRAVSPLAQADDATVVDASDLTLEQVIDAVSTLVANGR